MAKEVSVWTGCGQIGEAVMALEVVKTPTLTRSKQWAIKLATDTSPCVGDDNADMMLY